MDHHIFETLEKPALLFLPESGAVEYMNPAARLLFACKADTAHIVGLFGGEERQPAETLMALAQGQSSVKDYCFRFTALDGRSTERMLFMSSRVCGDRRLALCVFDEIYPRSSDEAVQKVQFYDLFQKIFFASVSGGDDTVSSILAILGSYLDASRTYIFRLISNGRYISNTLEWCASGVESVKRFLSAVPVDEHSDFIGRIRDSGQINVSDINEFDEITGKGLAAQGIMSMCATALYINGNFSGFIGLDETRSNRVWKSGELEMLRSAAIIISTKLGQHEAEAERSRTREMFGEVIDSMDELVYVVDMKNNDIIYANKMVHGLMLGNATGKKCHSAVFGKNYVCGDCPRQEMLAEGVVPSGVAIREMRSPVTNRWYWIKSKIIVWHDGRSVQLCCANDITARKHSERELIKLARTDKMTGIYSRDFGIKLLRDAIGSMYESREPLTVCFMDIDGLKQVNDTFGHAEGDNMLIAVVNAVRHSTRSTDIFVRMGGDEFLLVLNGTPCSGAEKVMESIEKKLGEINAQKLYPYELSVSMGLYEVTADGGENVDEILQKADAEMYLRKAEHKKARQS